MAACPNNKSEVFSLRFAFRGSGFPVCESRDETFRYHRGFIAFLGLVSYPDLAGADLAREKSDE